MQINRRGLEVMTKQTRKTNDRDWTPEQIAKGYREMAAINLQISEEFFALEQEVDERINKNN